MRGQQACWGRKASLFPVREGGGSGEGDPEPSAGPGGSQRRGTVGPATWHGSGYLHSMGACFSSVPQTAPGGRQDIAQGIMREKKSPLSHSNLLNSIFGSIRQTPAWLQPASVASRQNG